MKLTCGGLAETSAKDHMLSRE